MTADELFLITIEELERLLELKAQQVDAIALSAALRKLVIEGGIVAGAANPRKEKIEYEISDGGRPPANGDWAPGIALDPDVGVGSSTIVDRQGLLHHVAMVEGGMRITVGDIIKYVANYAGGVHTSRPDKPEMSALANCDWSAHYTTPEGRLSGAAYALLPIARVVLRGLTPLRTRVAAETRGPNFSPTMRGLRRDPNGPNI